MGWVGIMFDLHRIEIKIVGLFPYLWLVMCYKKNYTNWVGIILYRISGGLDWDGV
jgi:hypothetical protein